MSTDTARNQGARTARIVPGQMDKLLRLEEVAEMTGIPEGTLRWWRQENTGPQSAKLGRRVVYREADVRAWIDTQFESVLGGGGLDPKPADAEEASRLAEWIIVGKDSVDTDSEVVDAAPVNVELDEDSGVWSYTSSVLRPDGVMVTATILEPEDQHHQLSSEYSEIVSIAASRLANGVQLTIEASQRRDDPDDPF